MIKTTLIYTCDVCGEEQQGHTRNIKGFRVTADGEDKFPHTNHVCKECRHAIYLGIGRTISDLRGIQ